jgi:DNA-binding SARP family transcriptional activator
VPSFAFGVLGPLEVIRDGQPVVISAPKLRVLLAALLIGANRTLSIDQLAARLWDEQPPTGARKAIQVSVVRLRQLLGDELIVTGPDGYRLPVEPDQLDLCRFNRLTDAARQAANAGDADAELRHLTEALACWRGPALADVPSESLQREVVAQLAESRLRATERRTQVALDLGQHREIITDLVQLTKDHPWQEAFWVQLILALHRSDRLADALDTYRTVHRKFRDELGVDPSEHLQQLHGMLLAGQLDLPDAGRVPVQVPVHVCQLPAEVRGFVGREAQVEQLTALLGTDAVIVSGPPGVGKTALALHVAHRLRPLFADGGLYVDLQGYATDPPLTPAAALTRFLHALGVPRDQVPSELEAMAALYRSTLGGRNMLVLLDNAGEPDQVRPLLPGGPGCAVLITSRNDLRGLTAREGAVHVKLEELTPEQSHLLLTGLIGADRAHTEPDAVAELAETCGFLPLALRIAGANLAADPYDTVAGYLTTLGAADRVARLAIDGDECTGVRVAFDRSYLSLADEDRRLFRLLGLAPGPDLTVAAAAALAEREPGETRRALDRLAAANLLHRHAPGRYRFHDLIREYAADRARGEDDTAAALDRIFDFYLHTASAATRLLYPGAPRLPLPTTAEPPSTEAEALGWLDDERHNLLAAMTRAAGSPAHYSRACQLVDVLREYLDARANAAEAISGCEAALRAATIAADHQAEVSVLDVLGRLYYLLGEYHRATEYHGRALAVAEHSQFLDGQSRALLNLGRVYKRRGLMTQAEEYHLAALELSRSCRDRTAECVALNAVGVVRMYSGRPTTALDWHHQSIELGRKIGNREATFRAFNGLGMTYWALGELDKSIECHEQVLAYARETGQLQGEAAALLCIAEVHSEAGRYELALRLAAEGMAHVTRLGDRRAQANALDITGTTRRCMGEHAAAIKSYTESLHIANKISFGYGQVSVPTGLAAVHRCLDEPRLALNYLRQAQVKLTETGLLLLEARVLTEAALIHHALGARQDALTCAERAVDLASTRGQRLVHELALRARQVITAPVS